MTTKPNILFFFTDQQRYDTVGCYGQKLNVTPNLDRLAKEGIKFEYAFTCQPVCGPARSCLQTGRYATDTGCYTNGRALDVNMDTIAKQLKRAGYETAYVGKWHLASDRHKPGEHLYAASPIPLERCGGYEDYLAIADVLEATSHGYNGYVFDKEGRKMEFTGYRADCITDYAVDYLQNKNSEDPFLLFISYIEPHQQNDHGCYEGPAGSRERFRDYEVPKDLLCGDFEGDWKQNYPDYLGQCGSLDYNLGRILDVLKEKGLYENTIIVYTSDHGNHFKTREGEYKRQCFENCLRIPFIIRGGEFRGGKTYTDLVSLINLPPTVMELAGLPVPEYMPERSLLHLLHDDEPWQEEIFYQISETDCARGIRTKRYKYCVWAPHKQPVLRMNETFSGHQYHYEMIPRCRADSDSYVEQYLFDLVKDPVEADNLILNPEYGQIRNYLRERLISRMERAGERAPVIYPAGTDLSCEYSE